MAGLDELRRFNYLNKKTIPLYGNKDVLKNIKKKYSYIFHPMQIGGGVPKINLHTIKAYKPFNFLFVKIIPLLVFHGKLKILGFRFNNFAYITDASFLPEKTMAELQNLDLLILNSLRYEPHSTHFNLKESLEIVKKLKPKQAFFIHLTHFFEHETVNKSLPSNVQLAYDGLKYEL